MLAMKPDVDKPVNGMNEDTNGMDTHPGGPILRVDMAAAGEGLDELFKAVINGDQQRLTQQVPMRQRRLPPSFFRPPSAASSTNSVNHSRESSIDGGYQSNAPTPAGVGGKVAFNGLQIIHPRANSSPAELQRPNLTGVNGLAGQTAFGSSELKATGAVNGAGATNGGSHFRQMSYDPESIRLPDGWEMSFTLQGERYFLNHKEKTTTWEDPRKLILEEMTRRSTGNLLAASPQTATPPIILQSLMHQQQQQQSAAEESLLNGAADPAMVPLPDGWEKARTGTGDIYFISHTDQTTTWFHPAIPRNLQMKRVAQHQQQNHSAQPPPFQTNSNIPHELVAALKNMNCQTPTSAPANPLEAAFKSQTSAASQHLRDLELERERMRQRQEELLQNNLLTSNASSLLLSSSSEPVRNQQSPFLRNECHSRQESADSGLDLGNSSNYSMPHTPDNFLGTSNGALNVNGNSNGALGGPTPSGLADDLSFDNMISLDLPDESMDFMQGLESMDLLSNVEELLNTNKDNLTWFDSNDSTKDNLTWL